MERLIQIVPCFPPAIDGVGDFAQALGQELERSFGVESVFLCPDRKVEARGNLVIATDRTTEALETCLGKWPGVPILLQYSGYGYDARGIPTWLVEGLEGHVRKTEARLNIFFHEVWSAGPFWKSEFYLGRIQKNLLQRLHRIADCAFTSTPKMERLLRESGPRASVVPIPSPVPATFSRRTEKRSMGVRLAVFGQEHTRARTLREHAGLIRALEHRTVLDAILLIGKGARGEEVGVCVGANLAKRTVAFPNAEPALIHNLLDDADAMLSFYPSNLVTKSSSIMAAFGCGCPVILPSNRGSEQFEPRPPLLFCDGSVREVDDLLQRRRQGEWRENGEAAFAWYQAQANLSVTAVRIGTGLRIRLPAEMEILV